MWYKWPYTQYSRLQPLGLLDCTVQMLHLENTRSCPSASLNSIICLISYNWNQFLVHADIQESLFGQLRGCVHCTNCECYLCSSGIIGASRGYLLERFDGIIELFCFVISIEMARTRVLWSKVGCNIRRARRNC